MLALNNLHSAVDLLWAGQHELSCCSAQIFLGGWRVRWVVRGWGEVALQAAAPSHAHSSLHPEPLWQEKEVHSAKARRSFGAANKAPAQPGGSSPGVPPSPIKIALTRPAAPQLRHPAFSMTAPPPRPAPPPHTARSHTPAPSPWHPWVPGESRPAFLLVATSHPRTRPLARPPTHPRVRPPARPSHLDALDDLALLCHRHQVNLVEQALVGKRHLRRAAARTAPRFS